MASLSTSTTLLLLLLLLSLSLSISQNPPELKSRKSLSRMEEESEPEPSSKPLPKKIPIFNSKNQTKLIKPKKTNSTTTTPAKSSSATITITPKFKLKFNKTLTNSTLKPIKSISNSTKPIKSSSNSTKTQLKSTIKPKNSTSNSPKPLQKAKTSKPKKPDPEPESLWLEDHEMDGEDLISEFRDLPSRIHQTLLPDLEKLSTTSKAYISRANREIAEGVKPFVGNKYAPKIASIASCLFLILPLLLVTALFHYFRDYLSLQRVLIFVQAYLAIYFATLSLTAVVTGLEPLRFFYATSPSSYAWTQAIQTLGYVLYLLVQLINLVVVFSAGDSEIGARALGLAQMVVGLAVGLHYYAAVFHRAVLGEPPRANWKIHGVYAACFLVICAFAGAERRKKAYLQEGGEDGKKS